MQIDGLPTVEGGDGETTAAGENLTGTPISTSFLFEEENDHIIKPLYWRTGEEDILLNYYPAIKDTRGEWNIKQGLQKVFRS